MLSERMLKKWRKEALSFNETEYSFNEPGVSVLLRNLEEGHKRILKMTQELLDQHLLRREK